MRFIAIYFSKFGIDIHYDTLHKTTSSLLLIPFMAIRNAIKQSFPSEALVAANFWPY